MYGNSGMDRSGNFVNAASNPYVQNQYVQNQQQQQQQIRQHASLTAQMRQARNQQSISDRRQRCLQNGQSPPAEPAQVRARRHGRGLATQA